MHLDPQNEVGYLNVEDRLDLGFALKSPDTTPYKLEDLKNTVLSALSYVSLNRWRLGPIYALDPEAVQPQMDELDNTQARLEAMASQLGIHLPEPAEQTQAIAS